MGFRVKVIPSCKSKNNEIQGDSRRFADQLVSTKTSRTLRFLKQDRSFRGGWGHAFFDGPGEQSSGLLVAGGDKFTLADLRSIGTLPRMAFVNACRAGRVRGAAEDVAPSAAFAEFFLRSGIEAYIGTDWQVSDAGAAKFATNIYSGLAGGITLDAAIKQASTQLFESGDNEWANYIFYGNGLFRLRLSQQ